MAGRASPPSELLSGPDLGGGYLHQLSLDVHDAGTTFTHHAQDGGQDAGGPPVGELGALGFVHPPSPCMFGGPRCWHRRYLLPRSAAARVRFAYQRHRFVLETMLRQVHGGMAVPFETALREVAARLAEPLAAEGADWYVAGSTAVWLAGGGGAPHDVDLGTTRAGVDRIGELLREYLIEPVAPTDWARGHLVVGGRAFVGTPRAGARVEWAVPLEPRAPLALEELVGVAGVTRVVELPFEAGAKIRISRPEYALLRAAERERPEAVDSALRAIARLGVDVELLDVLLTRSPLAEPARRALRTRAVP